MQIPQRQPKRYAKRQTALRQGLRNESGNALKNVEINLSCGGLTDSERRRASPKLGDSWKLRIPRGRPEKMVAFGANEVARDQLAILGAAKESTHIDFCTDCVMYNSMEVEE